MLSMTSTTGSDGAARIWDVATGEELHTVLIPGYDGGWGVWGPSFSPDACETGIGEKVTWRFEPEDLAWSGGVGLRFRFVP